MVKVKDWLSWWKKDGFKMVPLKETEKEKELWQLYSIKVPYDSEYGRHMGALVVVDKKSNEILAHDTTNEWVHGGLDVDRNPSQAIYDWFDRHVGEGLTI